MLPCSTTSQRFITPLDASPTLYLSPVLGRTEIWFTSAAFFLTTDLLILKFY